MSYAAHDPNFASIGGIQDLNMDEIEQVDGAWLLAVVVVVAVMGAAYYAGRSQGDC